MPHIKVEPFNTSDIINSNIVESVGISKSGNELLLVNFDDRRVVVDVIKKANEYLIKPSKITKGSNIEYLKELLTTLADDLNLVVTHSNINPKPNKPKVAHWAQKSIEDFYNFKSDFKKIKLEVGFGSARHLLYRANEERDTLFIGIEIHTPSINQLLTQINLQELDNIWVVNYDARLLLEMLPSNILDTIYVHFPVPWDKKPHRRVISDFFINEALRALKSGAILELRTDSQNYYEYSLEVFSKPKSIEFEVKKNIDIEVISKYEQRWRNMNKDIYTLRVKSLNDSKSRDINIDFSFDSVNIVKDIENIHIVKDDYFIHFGREYKTDSGFLIECAFGSFNTPEKKILVVDKNRCYYLPSSPVKSLVNQKAHNLIKEVLNG